MHSNVESFMKEKGISVQKMSKDLHVSNSEISKSRHHIEFCSMILLMQIADYLGCKVKDLFEEEE